MRNKLLYFLILLTLPSLCSSQILDQLSKSKEDSPVIIEAEKSVVCDETAHKCVATGLAKAQKDTNTVYGDVLTVYFTDDREITSMTADGHVRMETPTEKAYGEHAHYDVALDRIRLTGGNLKIVTPKETLTARDSIEYWHSKNQGIARGNAVARFPEKKEIVQADTLVAYFKPSSEKTEEGKEKQTLDRVEAEGNTLASSPDGIVTGDRGVYSAQTGKTEVFGNVTLTQGKNVIKGGYAQYNLKTNIAEVFPHPPHISDKSSGQRVSGIIFSKDAKKLKAKGSKRDEASSQKQKGGRLFPISAKQKHDTPSQIK